jgi:hypothetical protein
MPPLERMDRRQTAVLWGKSGVDRYGEPKVAEPDEIEVRWVTGRKESTAKDGSTIALDAEAIVGQRIAVGSQMWLGTLEEWYGTGSSGDATEVMRVATYEEVPDIKGRNVQRVVGLMRFRDAPGERA